MTRALTPQSAALYARNKENSVMAMIKELKIDDKKRKAKAGKRDLNSTLITDRMRLSTTDWQPIAS